MVRLAGSVVAVLASLLLALAAQAAPERRPLQVQLFSKGIPPASTPPAALPEANRRSIALVVEDGRGADAGSMVGQALDDGVPVWPIIATNDVRAYVEQLARSVLGQWGISLGEAERGTLKLRFTRFSAAHNNRAVGATYVGDTTFEASFVNRRGKVVARGTFSGSVDHYGRGRSAEGVNEVLGESLAEALAWMLNDPQFRRAWSAGADDEPPPARRAKPAAAPSRPANAPAPPAAAAEAAPAAPPAAAPAAAGTPSVEDRLRRVEELWQRGVISKDERDRQRAKILEEL